MKLQLNGNGQANQEGLVARVDTAKKSLEMLVLQEGVVQMTVEVWRGKLSA